MLTSILVKLFVIRNIVPCFFTATVIPSWSADGLWKIGDVRG